LYFLERGNMDFVSFLTPKRKIEKEDGVMQNTKSKSNATVLTAESFVQNTVSLKIILMCTGVCRMLSVPVRLSVLA